VARSRERQLAMSPLLNSNTTADIAFKRGMRSVDPVRVRLYARVSTIMLEFLFIS
jgi:hypothetical protein